MTFAVLIFVLFALATLIAVVRQLRGAQHPVAAQKSPEIDTDPVPSPTTTFRPAPASDAPSTSGLGTAPVTTLKGLGPKVAAQLDMHGIATVADLAALSDDDAAALDARLGAFAGRIARDRWIEQARLLAAGDIAGFEAAFGKLGS
jgi:predicted flap endonuclease-1-like 5' DNA nuclease